MTAPALLQFPLPILTALLCAVIAVLAWRLELGARRASSVFAVLFALGAVEALLVALRFGYGVTSLIPLQRQLPLFIGPLMYLGFLSLTMGKRRFARVLLFHLSAPVGLVALAALLTDNLAILDWVISASYAAYIAALLLLWRGGQDALIYARVELSRSLSSWMLRGMGFLAFLLIMDTAIALDFALNRGSNVAALITYGTVPLIALLVAAIVALPSLLAPARAPAKAPAAAAEDTALERRLHDLLTREHLFLDPDLSVQRLAKRLHVPARSLSAAVNRSKGMNVSQYVNSFRLAFAADLLRNGSESVARIAEKSGFLTRSNFYREFQRVYACSPTAYRRTGTPS